MNDLKWPPSGGGGKRRPGGGGFKFDGKLPAVPALGAAAFAVMLMLLLVMGMTGKLGVTNINAQQVGVIVNYLTGDEEVVTTPGFKLYIPFLQEVYVFDRTTQDFLMEGNRFESNNRVPALTVRASDGSLFRFNDIIVQYELIPGAAGTALHDSGPGDGFKEEWVKSYARSIMRDEFGRYSAVEVANPTVYKQAPIEVNRRMNEMLEPHGLRVVLIKTPFPQFDDAYEDAIEKRKTANQEVERLIAEKEQLEQQKERRLATVRRQKEVEMRELEGEMERLRLMSEADSIQIMKSADAYATKREAEGQAEQAELLARAGGLEAKYTKEAEGIVAKAKALEERGEVIVREALVRKLLSVKFTLLPYSRDSEPKRLEHVNGPRNETGRVDVETALEGGR